MNKISTRLASVDLVRGIVLILMMLDHVRIYFSNVKDPLDLTDTTGLLFFTRWITHYCAPTFVFLAGLSVYLYAYRGNHSNQQTSFFLITRGLWLIFLECTVMFIGSTFFLIPFKITILIIATMGLSMIILAGLIWLPISVILSISILMIVGHNLLDLITPAAFGEWSWVWMLLHSGGKFEILSSIPMNVYYPLIPWPGVMALGYCMGRVFVLPENERRKIFLGIGLLLTAAFFLLRYLNVYGDPLPWSVQENTFLTFLSFLNTTKYPPSLLYLLMTLGPAFIVIGLISENFAHNKVSKFFVNLGRVPLFFYVIHIPIIFVFALTILYFRAGIDAIFLYRSLRLEYGYDITMTYLIFFLLLPVIYCPCVWYSSLKARSKQWYFSYL